MGILSINRNLLSKFKSKLKPLSSSSSYSSDPNGYIRRFLSAAAPTTSLSDGQKPMFLIEKRFRKGCPNYYLLSAPPADDDGSSWKDHLHPISIPLSSKHELSRGFKEWTLFFDYEITYQCRVSLWNPITKRIHTLAPPFSPSPQVLNTRGIRCSGFGFEPKSQDYKFIGFLHGFLSNSHDQNHIELYSLKTDSWKLITATPSPPTRFTVIPLERNSVCANGVYYWELIGGLSNYSILSFDFADETFSVIRFPRALEGRKTLRNCILVEFHGSLAILVHSDLIYETDEPFWFEVQVRRAKRWRRKVPKVTIVLARDRVSRVIGLFQNDYLFLEGRKKGQLMLFNLKTSKLENLDVYANPLYSTTLSICPFFVPT